MRKVQHTVKVSFLTASGVDITRPVTIEGARNRGEALARVKATAKAYVPKGATVKGVTL